MAAELYGAWSKFDDVIAKIKRLRFLRHTLLMSLYYHCNQEETKSLCNTILNMVMQAQASYSLCNKSTYAAYYKFPFGSSV